MTNAAALYDSRLVDSLRGLRLRPEPSGHFVAFHPEQAHYVFVNRPGATLIGDLAAGAEPADCARALRASSGASPEHVDARLCTFARELTGSPAAAPPAEQDGLPHAWTLRSELGDGAERCETFGMPL